ncbi:unnamed protein product [Ambrosiozyma monospora]|uniref:Unnamed protein product n=1 Tax=Ambrosiozyma monospora TaxID=43982 RepID=A0A9W6YZN6_AMBMO|nr:unnamed protein product [Ambrosiozyma monospora]
MMAKGVISKELEWSEARRFFFWRARRRLNEEHLIKRIGDYLNNPASTRLEKVSRLNSWYPSSLDQKDDKAVALWIEEHHKNLDSHLKRVKSDGVKHALARLFKSDMKSTSEGLGEILNLLSSEDKQRILKHLK